MKKLAILSPLVILMASTSLAQDSCIVRPSCADMGYTKTESQCEGKDSIKCPFDLTALFCHENESSEIEPDPEPIECDFGYLSQNGECLKIDNAIAFVLSVNANEGSIKLYTGTTSGGYKIDWGDGTIEDSLTTDYPSHNYADIGEYQIVITGNVPRFYISSLSNSYPIEILNLDLDTVKSYSKESNVGTFVNCENVVGYMPDEISPNVTNAKNMFLGCNKLSGTIPPLPNRLVNAEGMFKSCNNLTGSIPELPSTLTNTNSMFYGCSKLTGNIPELPSTLTDASSMFFGCSSLNGTIPNIPNLLTSGYQMFRGCNNLTGNIPELPSGLTNALEMFSGCSKLTGSIPTLPSTLTNGEAMFQGCLELTGSIPTLPANLRNGNEMFNACRNLTGNITELPSSLYYAKYMFSYASGLSGISPAKPSGLYNTYCTDIFANTQVTNDGSWPDDAW
ncbi:MAG: leucine-rich repeat protein [Alphaproteobacteria bacterium]|nr:leucine-rich repeat protein [Alphaproteobacteria bacterium]